MGRESGTKEEERRGRREEKERGRIEKDKEGRVRKSEREEEGRRAVGRGSRRRK